MDDWHLKHFNHLHCRLSTSPLPKTPPISSAKKEDLPCPTLEMLRDKRWSQGRPLELDSPRTVEPFDTQPLRGKEHRSNNDVYELNNTTTFWTDHSFLRNLIIWWTFKQIVPRCILPTSQWDRQMLNSNSLQPLEHQQLIVVQNLLQGQSQEPVQKMPKWWDTQYIINIVLTVVSVIMWSLLLLHCIIAISNIIIFIITNLLLLSKSLSFLSFLSSPRPTFQQLERCQEKLEEAKEEIMMLKNALVRCT